MKTKKTLADWRRKPLSKAARGILIKIVLATYPLYGTQTTKFACSTLDELEKLNRDFFLGEMMKSVRNFMLFHGIPSARAPEKVVWRLRKCVH